MNQPSDPSQSRNPYGASFVDGTPDKVMYLTDDRDHDLEDQRSLVILHGGNGDWYVQVAGANGRTVDGVRICTSGGASTHCPGLGPAIAAAYHAMRASAEGLPPPESTVGLREEVQAWRDRFPKLVFDRFEIVPDYNEDGSRDPDPVEVQADLIAQLRRMAVRGNSDLGNDIVKAIDAVMNASEGSGGAAK